MEKNPNPIKDQFFLKDQKVLKDIVDTIDMKPGETIVEIGGGEGALTDYLVKANGGMNFITVIEKDPYYAAYLKDKYKGRENVEVIEGDALTFDFSLYDRIVANLPYTITEPFLINLAMSGCFGSQDKSKNGSMVKSTTLLLSQNSVRKMVAPAQILDGGSKYRNYDFGISSAICKSFLDVEIVRAVASESFFPMPAVTSIVVNLTPKEKLTTVDRIMQHFLVDKKGSKASISRIYGMILAQGKVYNLNKYKDNFNLISHSFTSKLIENKNIYELNNDQLSTLVQDLIKNDMKVKSSKFGKQIERKRVKSYDEFESFEDYDFYLEELEKEEIRFEKKSAAVKKANDKYNYMNDATAYNVLAKKRGLEYLPQDEFISLVRGERPLILDDSKRRWVRKKIAMFKKTKKTSKISWQFLNIAI